MTFFTALVAGVIALIHVAINKYPLDDLWWFIPVIAFAFLADVATAALTTARSIERISNRKDNK